MGSGPVPPDLSFTQQCVSMGLLTSKTGLNRIRIRLEILPSGNNEEGGGVFYILQWLECAGALPLVGLAPMHTADYVPHRVCCGA